MTRPDVCGLFCLWCACLLGNEVILSRLTVDDSCILYCLFMRLTQQEQKVICDSINRVDPEARILLFGSRVDDQARGGDIDILCLSSEINRQQRRLIRREMGDRLAGQKIDLVIAPDSSKPFVRLVMAEAVPLTVSL